MNKSLVIITGSESTKDSLHNQLIEYIPKEIEIFSYSLELINTNHIECDILLISSNHALNNLKIKNITYDCEHLIIAKRTINFDNIDLIVPIPPNTDVLLVNDTEASTYEAIEILNNIGIDYLNYIPYYPSLNGIFDKVNIAITIGELDKVPPFVDKIYNVGTRIIDFQTIAEILNCAGILLSNAESFSNRYLQKIINLAKRLTIASNENAKISKGLRKKGFYAKYTFDDIIGDSIEMLKVKDVLKKLSHSNLTILLNGESGCGKELFASAIHNESDRKNGPFLAINFSSLNDELIESELFGYEEGSFTGARKGGKEGFFELAKGGTIFLDEIGDISLKMQSRLLRVLQEKEIIKIGGHEVKPLDVRIIAATNKNLFEMVKKNEFRKDLFYRLKMGYVKIPPLRNRKSDLPLLIDTFVNQESDYTYSITSEAINELCKYEWHGNVRELQNTISYMIALSQDNVLKLEDVPPTEFFQDDFYDDFSLSSDCFKYENKIQLNDLENEILQVIYKYNLNKTVIGRKILLNSLSSSFDLSEYALRKNLTYLESLNYLSASKGKVGIILTDLGKNYILTNRS